MASEGDSSEYFSSYSDLSVHALMLKDKPRTLAYKNFIEENAYFFSGKTVLDVGAGTGILSLFCASAGAKRVFAVEASNMADICSEIVKCNNLSDVVTVIKGEVEKIELPVKSVDVIVSEWMGFYLLHESMLDSVLYARDKWLSPKGIMVPSVATLYIAPVNMSSYVNEHFRVWEKVYGYDFSPFQVATMTQSLQQPVITCIDSSQLLAEPEITLELDLRTATIDSVQSLQKTFSFEIKKSGLMHAFAFWFDIYFSTFRSKTENDSNLNIGGKSITLSTSASSEETHWKQTMIFLPVSASVDAGEKVSCKLELGQDCNNKRHYNISIETLDDWDGEDSGKEDNSDISNEEEEEDTRDHPMPCDCGAGRCNLIKALMAKYDAEELEHEAEDVEVNAEVEAAKIVDMEAMENGDITTSCDSS